MLSSKQRKVNKKTNTNTTNRCIASTKEGFCSLELQSEVFETRLNRICFTNSLIRDFNGMQFDKIRPIIIGILHILTDLLNVAEHLVIYFIVKQDNLSDAIRQRFFFILFAVRGATIFDDCFYHPSAKVAYSILVETAEYVCYMNILPRTRSLVTVASIMFGIIIVSNSINFILVIKDPRDTKFEFILHLCFVPLRLIAYGLLYLIHVLTLFLDTSSKFRADLYEILMILATSFGAMIANKLFFILVKQLSIQKEQSETKGKLQRHWLTILWELILFTIIIVTYLTIMIVGLVYTSGAFYNTTSLITYDYVIYVIFTIFYGLGLLALLLTVIILTVLHFCGSKVISLEKGKHFLMA